MKMHFKSYIKKNTSENEILAVVVNMYGVHWKSVLHFFTPLLVAILFSL